MEYGFGGDKLTTGNFTSTKVLPAFKKQFPEIEEGVRMAEYERVMTYEDKMFNEKKIMFADSTFFKVFSMSLEQGNIQTALNGPKKIILTRSTANKYFGNSDPVGKTILLGSGKIPYEITGIMKDCPTNSQMRFTMLASFSSLGANQEETYWNANYTTYFLFRHPADIKKVEARIPAFMQSEMKDAVGTKVNFYFEPLLDIHLHSTLNGFEPTNNITYIYIISGVALLMLLIACFTYINLNTARSLERAKEVGIRKTVGAAVKQIFWQFMGESAILTLFAAILTFAVVVLVLPLFNELAGKEIPFNLIYSGKMLLAIGVSVILIIVLSGSYPSLIVSRFQPIKVLKGSFSKGKSGTMLRRSLTVFQFGISLFLLVSSFIIQKQLHYIRNKNLGFDKEQVLIIPSDGKILSNFSAFKSEMKKVPGVQWMGRAQDPPHKIIGGYSMRSAAMAENTSMNVAANPIDEEYIKATGLQLLYGQDLSQQDVERVANYTYDMDPEQKDFAFIINESAARQLGWEPSEAVGKKMFLDNTRPGHVKGVVKDFHFQSMHTAIGSLVLFPMQWSNIMLVKTSGTDIRTILTGMEQKWKLLAPHRPFQYSFLDEQFDSMYSSEMRLGKVFTIFTGISILLACIGLLGLCSYAAQQRVKEIGIRKILGARVVDIIQLLSADFVKLVIISMLIAFPLAYYCIDQWLQAFVYRAEVSWWIFLAAAFIGVILVLVTTSFLAIRTSLNNPVKNLRTE
jgi:putative ABC transport system permease protein